MSKKENIRSAAFTEKLLAKITDDRSGYFLTGDLLEEYHNIRSQKGKLNGYFWYWKQVFRIFLAYMKFSLINGAAMFLNYFKIAIRNLVRNKIYSLINISGLSLGLTCFILILLYVQFETSYDSFQKNGDRVFRVVRSNNSGELTRTWPLLVPTLVEMFPEVEKGARVNKAGGSFRYNDKNFREDGRTAYVEFDFFDIFSFPFIAGNRETVFDEPNTVVITERTAKKYFGNENPLGKVLTLDNEIDFKVSGVISDVPKNSHIHIDIFLSYHHLLDMYGQGINVWNNSTFYSYVMLRDNSSVQTLEEKMPDFVEKVIFANSRNSNNTEIVFQPIKDIHLNSNRREEFEANGSAMYVYSFSFIAIFILLIACINFMNLSTIHSEKRAKEVAVRKVIGARKSQLAKQFLGEAILINLISLAAAVFLVIIAIPAFNNFANIKVNFDILNNLSSIIYLIGLAVIVGLISGSYPAFVLSSFQPADSLKGGHKTGLSGILLRKGLVIFQFALSIFLIIGTFLITDQVDFMKNRDMGFDKEQLVVVKNPGGYGGDYSAFKNALLADPLIKSAAGSGDVLGRMFTTLWGVAPNVGGKGVNALIVDEDYINTYGMEIIAGRDFRKDEGETSFILNEQAIKYYEFGSPEKAIGSEFRMQGSGTVIGVVKDFNFFSLHKEIEPMVLAVWTKWRNNIAIKIDGNNIRGSLAAIETTWKSVHPDKPFEYYFFDENFNTLYNSEETFNTVFKLFSLLAIVIACLGLFGLASFTVQQRTKEIGIRKILGADFGKIIKLLSGEFIKPVIIANVIAWPAAYYIMNSWLSDFAYRINIGFSEFVLTAVMAAVIAMATISFQAVKASLSNPVNALRAE